MDNIYDYIDNYGAKSFKEEPLNDIDLMVFSAISYVDFSGIMDYSSAKVSLNDLAELYFLSHNKKEVKHNILGVAEGIKILKYIVNTRRYRFLKVYNYNCIYTDEEQFSGIFIDVTKHLTVVAFTGTNELVSGWREDANLAYSFPVPAQKDAINMINSHIHLFSHRRYVFTGHSKGGNLALAAGMYLKPYKRFRLKQIVSLDGPGLRLEQKNSKQYKKIDKRYKLIIPNSSIVGLLLEHKDQYTVIKSSKNGVMAHHLIYWEINENELVPSELNNFAIKCEKAIKGWFGKYDDETIKNFWIDLFDIFQEAGIDNLLDLKYLKIKKVLGCLKATKNIDESTKKMISTFIKDVVNIFMGDND